MPPPRPAPVGDEVRPSPVRFSLITLFTIVMSDSRPAIPPPSPPVPPVGVALPETFCVIVEFVIASVPNCE
jgi:hypothetical protein